MPSTAAVGTALAYSLLVAYVGASAGYLLWTVGARLCVRRPRCALRSRDAARLPLGPALVLLVATTAPGGAVLAGAGVPLSVLVGVPSGGVFWAGAAWLRRSVLVTAYGVVPDPLRTGRAVAWRQVVDVALTTRDGRTHVVVLYRARDTQALRRLALTGPLDAADELRALVRTKRLC
jgi:hypothetical protein